MSMSLPGVGRLRWKAHQTARWVRSRVAPGALILLYHRVADVLSDPWGLSVTPQHFAEQMAVLRQSAHPMPLQEMARALQQGKALPRRAVAVTFDDGYADNLHEAQPILERFGVPATIFLVSGSLGCAREFWWDELDRMLLQPGRLPQTLHLAFKAERCRWSLGEAAHYALEEAQHHRSWRVEDGAPPTPRHALYLDLWTRLHPLPVAERGEILSEIRTWAALPLAGRPGNFPLSSEETLRLAESDLIELGAHTVTHAPLSMHSAEEQRREIEESKQALEERLGRPVASFSYPYGLYTPDTLSLTQEAGYAYACAVEDHSVRRGANPFALPRAVVSDEGGDAFGRWLSGAFA